MQQYVATIFFQVIAAIVKRDRAWNSFTLGYWSASIIFSTIFPLIWFSLLKLRFRGIHCSRSKLLCTTLKKWTRLWIAWVRRTQAESKELRQFFIGLPRKKKLSHWVFLSSVLAISFIKLQDTFGKTFSNLIFIKKEFRNQSPEFSMNGVRSREWIKGFKIPTLIFDLAINNNVVKPNFPLKDFWLLTSDFWLLKSYQI